jgi:hypothetical protein
MGPQPVTSPASCASEHVWGVQHVPLVHFSLPLHVPQFTAAPQPLFTSPQVIEPHAGGAQPVHVPFSHLLLPVQPPHVTWPLPHAFVRVPHFEPVPPSSPAHSGGGAVHRPPVQS